MWHILEGFNRRVAKKVSKKEALFLQSKLGGELSLEHIPRPYTRGLKIEEPFEGEIVGYASNEKQKYNYGQLEIVADGVLVATVTRKQDAFRIMAALKRDYKDIIVRFK